MTVRDILVDPDPRLRTVCPEVEVFDASFAANVADLLETFSTGSWIGLSAPQIGVLERALVIDLSEARDSPQLFVNPEILRAADYAIVEESCASVPDAVGKVFRATKIHVRAQDAQGRSFESVLSDMRAVCLQHELDHLDGKLFIDRLPFWQRWRRKLTAG